jgi:EGF-like domain
VELTSNHDFFDYFFLVGLFLAGYPACPGTPQCRGNGACIEGVCLCNNQWSGSDCSLQGSFFQLLFYFSLFIVVFLLMITNWQADDVPITVIVNYTAPIVLVGLANKTESQSSGAVTFTIKFTKIEEFVPNGSIF